METSPYIDAEDIKRYTGVEAKNLKVADDAALDALLSEYISEAQEMVEAFLEKGWDPQYAGTKSWVLKKPVPGGVRNGVRRIVANMIAQARIRRTHGMMNVDEFRQTLVPDDIFTESIRSDLALYAGQNRIEEDDDKETVSTGERGFSMMVVNRRTVERNSL